MMVVMLGGCDCWWRWCSCGWRSFWGGICVGFVRGDVCAESTTARAPYYGCGWVVVVFVVELMCVYLCERSDVDLHSYTRPNQTTHEAGVGALADGGLGVLQLLEPRRHHPLVLRIHLPIMVVV